MADTSGYAPLRLTAELQSQINNALSQGHPVVLAVVDSSGQPQLSFRGLLQTYSDSQLGFLAAQRAGQDHRIDTL